MRTCRVCLVMFGLVLILATQSSYGATLLSDSFPGSTLDETKWVSVVPTNCEYAVVQNNGGAAYVYAYNNQGNWRVVSSLTTVNSFSIGSGLRITAKLMFPKWGNGVSSTSMDWTLRPSLRILNSDTGIEQVVIFSPFANNATEGVMATGYQSSGTMQYHTSSSALSTSTWRILELNLYPTSFTYKLYNLDGTLVDSCEESYDTISQVKLQFAASIGLNWPSSCIYGDDVVVEDLPVAAPVMSPGSKYITVPTSVEMHCDTPGAEIFYTTNGDTPTTASFHYTSAITVNPGTTVKAIAVVGSCSSEVTTATYAVLADPPEALLFLEDSFPGTTLDETKWVSVVPTNCEYAVVQNNDGAAYVYVYNNQGNWRVASSLTTVDSFPIGSGLRIAAKLMFPMWGNGVSSENMDWTLRPSFNVINADTGNEQLVLFSPFAYNAVEGVMATAYLNSGVLQSRVTSNALSTSTWRTLELILHRTSFTSKLYNADGSLADSWSGTYDAVDNVKLRFLASTGLNWPSSCIYGDDIVVEQAPAAAPVFNPAGPVITGPTEVTITCDTPDSSIFYTLNGDTPTTASLPYTGAVTVNQGTTLKAIAVAYGYARSPVTSVTYTAPLTVLDTITWPFDVTVNNGGSVYWTSLTAINPTCTHYDYSYEITKVEVKILATWVDITSQITEGLTGSGSVDSTVPFDVIPEQVVGGSYNGTDFSATIHGYVDSSGYLHVDVTNVDLGIVSKARITGSVTMTGSASVGTTAPILVVLPGSRSVDYVAGSTTFDVTNASQGSMAWSAQVITGGSWLSIASGSDSGTNAGTITVNVLANTVPVDRIGTIRVTATGATGSPRDITVVQAGAPLIPGDANKDGKVNVVDLGILATNYGKTSGTSWETGDFNDDGNVNVVDLGILATNYGAGTGSAQDTKALGETTEEDQDDLSAISPLGCSSAGLPMIAGLLLMSILLVKLDE